MRPPALSFSVVTPSPESLPEQSIRATTASTASNRVKFRPCIDIHQGKVKQIVGSTLKDGNSDRSTGSTLVTNFESTFPSSFYAELYKHSDLHGGHIIMLGQDDMSKRSAYSALLHYPGGMQVGGGVTSQNAAEYLDAGASHVIVTSFVFRNGHLDQQRLDDLVSLIGKQHLVLDLSCRKRGNSYYVVTDRWQKFSDLEISEATLGQLAKTCSEFLVHGVDVEGKKLGIDNELVEILGRYSPIPVTYAGGAYTLGDLETVKAAGNGRVDITVGSALDIFGGELPFQAVVDWHRLQACNT